MSAQRFAVEFDRQVVGVAVRVAGGFVFFPSDPAFDTLEGKVFSRVRAMSQRLTEVSGRSRAQAPSFSPAANNSGRH